MKLANLTPTEQKVFRAFKEGETLSASDVKERSKVNYGYVRVILNYFKRVGLIEHQGNAAHGAWKLSDAGSKLLKEGNDGRE